MCHVTNGWGCSEEEFAKRKVPKPSSVQFMKAKYKVRRFKHQKRYKNNDREIDSATLD